MYNNVIALVNDQFSELSTKIVKIALIYSLCSEMIIIAIYRLNALGKIHHFVCGLVTEIFAT